MTEQEVLTLAGLVQEASATLWAIALAKVYSQAIVHAVWAVAFFCGWPILTVFALRRAAYHKDGVLEEGDNILIGLLLGVSLVCLLAGVACAAGALARFVAPQYYAVLVIQGLL